MLEIVIPTYNRCRSLTQRLDELVSYQPRWGFRITVFDNGSSDDTPAVVERFSSYPFFSSHRAAVNGGISRNIMRCLEESTGDWVWTLSDDNETKPEDLELIMRAIESGRADIYTFKTQGNHIARNVVCSNVAAFLEDHDLITLGFLSASIYSRRAILAGMHVLAPAAYSLLPHCVLALAAVAKGCRIEFKTEELCRPTPQEHRISRKEFAIGAVTCLDFLEEKGLRRNAAKKMRASTRWMLVSAIAQTSTASDVASWKRACAIVDGNLNASGAGFFSAFLPGSFHGGADLRRELYLAILRSLPALPLLRIGARLAARTEQQKEKALFDSALS